MAKRAKRAEDVMRQADLTVAFNTVGSTKDTRLEWVAGFAAEDRSRWHSAERAARGDCLVVLTGKFVPSLVSPLPAPLTAREVDGLHEEIRNMLRAAVQDPRAVVPVPMNGVSRGLVRLTAEGEKPAQFANTYGHRFARTAVLAAVGDLIVTAGERLIACRHDRKPFYSNRKQLFCTPSCAQNYRNAKRPKKPGKRDL